MKKIFSSILCLAMILSTNIVAFAETNDFVLTYTNEANYEIRIPESGSVDKASGKGHIIFDIVDANLAQNQVIEVSISSKNYDNGWFLVNTKDTSDKIPYSINIIENGESVSNGEVVLRSSEEANGMLFINVADITKVGTFSDTITFTSEIIDDTLFEFMISDIIFEAEKGMTWEDWIGSNYTRGVNFMWDDDLEIITVGPDEDGDSSIIELGKVILYPDGSDLLITDEIIQTSYIAV